jgi:hypothetical protein
VFRKTDHVRHQALFWIALTAALTCLLTATGCSAVQSSSTPTTQVMALETARSQAAGYSSAVLDYSGITKGTVSPAGPILDTETNGVAHAYYMVHSWSIYGVPSSVLEQGFHKIHDGLQAHGWTITKYGAAPDADHTPEIQAEHPGDHYTITVQWAAAMADGTPKILVNLSSPMYLAPDGVNLDTSH